MLLEADLERPGVYEVLGADGKSLPTLGFAATLDPVESNLSQVKLEDLSAWFGEATVKASTADANRQPVS